MNYTTLLVEKKEKVGTITFNRPEKLNAFSEQAFCEFIEVLDEVDRDNEIAVVVITGAGRAFSAGLDLDEARQGPTESGLQLVPAQGSVSWIPHIMRNMKKPIIASINGHAVGAGFTIALACDIRIIAEEAKMGAPFVRMGLVPELGSTYSLPRLIGIAKACELIFTGKTIDAREALAIGLVNAVVPRDELEAATAKMAAEIATQAAPLPLQIAKKALYQGLDSDLVTQIAYEQLGQSTCFKSEDFKESVAAFQEKRKAIFKGK
jgi:2-(1,2-epoxy-1,2-dihydrophenyl)acetyl-CoA isomerase